MMARWRNWAFESAALDLALAQAGSSLHEAIGREPRRCASSTRSGWATRRRSTRSRGGWRRHPDLRFKLDVDWAWTPELMDEVAATGAVEIVDFKGHYGLEIGRAAALLDDVRARDRRLPGRAARGRPRPPRGGGAARRRGGSHLLRRADPLGRRPRRDAAGPAGLNIKPCRVGDLRSLLAALRRVRGRGLLMYGGGMGELGVGRDQIQLLASLFHPDGPNDTAPSGYNADTPAPDLPSSPLDAGTRLRSGFRRG